MAKHVLTENTEDGLKSTVDLIKQIGTELVEAGLGNTPEGKKIAVEIEKFYDAYQNATDADNTADISEMLDIFFSFDSRLSQLKKTATKYDYSDGNLGLLLLQGVFDASKYGPISYWKRLGMKPRDGARIKIIVKPPLSDDNDLTNTIVSELNKVVSFKDIKPKYREQIKDILDPTKEYKVSEIFNAIEGRPIDAPLNKYLDTMNGRNYLSQFVLHTFGRKDAIANQGWVPAIVYHEKDVVAIDQKSTTQEPTTSSSSITTQDIDEARETFTEVQGLMNDVNTMTNGDDEFSNAIFHELISDMENVGNNPDDPEATMQFITRLMEFNDNINSIRQKAIGYEYSMRNLMLITLQDPNIGRFGPRAWWAAQGMEPNDGAAGKVIFLPITDTNPMDNIDDIIYKIIKPHDIRSANLSRQIKDRGIDLDNGSVSVGELFNIINNKPMDHDFKSFPGWEINLSRFYITLTGLKAHKAIGYNVSFVYDENEVGPIEGSTNLTPLELPSGQEVTTLDWSKISNLKMIQGALNSIFEDISKISPIPDKNRQTVFGACIHKNKDSFVGGERNAKDIANVENATDNKGLNFVLKQIHILVHEVTHFNRGGLDPNNAANPKSKSEKLFYGYFNAKTGTRLYHNPEDYRGANRGTKSGHLTTALSHEGTLIRETQAEIITGLVAKMIGIDTSITSGNLALLSTAPGAKDPQNTNANEITFYLDVANTIAKKITDKMADSGLNENIDAVIDSILGNKKLLK